MVVFNVLDETAKCNETSGLGAMHTATYLQCNRKYICKERKPRQIDTASNSEEMFVVLLKAIYYFVVMDSSYTSNGTKRLWYAATGVQKKSEIHSRHHRNRTGCIFY